MAQEADYIIFHSTSPLEEFPNISGGISKIYEIVKLNKNKESINHFLDSVKAKKIFLCGETPKHTGLGYRTWWENGFFTLTATYNIDSDIYFPWGRILEKGNSEGKFMAYKWKDPPQKLRFFTRIGSSNR